MYTRYALGSVAFVSLVSPDRGSRREKRVGEGEKGGLAVYLGEELLVVLRAQHEVLHILHSLYGVHLGEHLTY